MEVVLCPASVHGASLSAFLAIVKEYAADRRRYAAAPVSKLGAIVGLERVVVFSGELFAAFLT